MIIDIVKLKSNVVNQIEIDEELSFDEENIKKAGILKLENVRITGSLERTNYDDYYLDVNVCGNMTLPSSITLKPVDVPFSIEIEGSIEEMLEEIGKIDKKRENTIDIFPIIWENILMEIPIKVESEDLNPPTLDGNGWRFITDDEPEINP